MAQNDARSLIASLREKQKYLNNAIDNYVELASDTSTDKVDVDAAQRSVASLSSSIAYLTKHAFWEAITLAVQPMLNTPVRMALDLDLFKIVTAGPTTVDDIVSATSADRTLVIRITRCLAAFNILDEVGPSTFMATPLSRSLTHPILADWARTNYDNCIPRNFKVPGYLDSRSHQGSIDIDAFNQSAFEGKSLWDQLSANPSQLAVFQSAMKLADTRPAEAAAEYDYTSNFGTPPPSGITLIDVGGGHGHAIDTIVLKHPDLPSKFILQDLPNTVDQLKADKSRELKFEPIVHDFFTPQAPNMRPRWFYLRNVLHDWSDASCTKILGHLRDAIADSSNSSILLAELVLPDKGATQFDTLMDINMMQLGGMERSESQWKELLDKVGLEIKGVTKAKMGYRCVLEVGVNQIRSTQARI